MATCATTLSAQTVTDLYSFTSDGSAQNPENVTPTQARNGEIYGTTVGPTYGSVFSLLTSGTETSFFSFDDADGQGPYAGLTLGTDGNFYGTTLGGGSAGLGVLFKITPGGAITVLHDFLGEADGGFPRAAPIEASDGNFYGTTESGSGYMGATVYKYAPSSNTFTTIYSFSETTDYGIVAPLIQATNGHLYGTGYYGSNNCGAIFELTTSGVLVMQYDFTCTGGTGPSGSLLQASDGNFYGTTYSGSGHIVGTVFKMTPNGRVTFLHIFTMASGEGWQPGGGLVEGTDGNLYGSTRQGGNQGDIGTVYQITTGGVFTELYSFPRSVGEYPEGALLQHTNGLFYGTASDGGAYGYGSVYTLNMGLDPFVTFVRPTGATGGQSQILGQGFTGTTSVTFNGVPATSFTVVSDTYMTAIVPSGATTGPVVVTTPSGPLRSNRNFTVVP
jgi:uncharacterized repeat protein (TIGR03803 family)